MLLWIILAALTAATLAAVLGPLRRPAATVPDASDDAPLMVTYRDQLTEIDSELARGLIAPEEAAAARVEIQRRLLRHVDTRHGASPSVNAMPRGFLTALMAGVPMAAIATYLAIGSPGLPDQPIAVRRAAAPETAQIEMLVARVEERLRSHPDDGQGWDVVAPVYARMGRDEQARDAWRQAIRLLGGTTTRWRGLAEASISAGQGVVDDEARAALEALHKDAPDDPIPRFWLAIAKEQRGMRTEAISDLKALIAQAPDGAPWREAAAGKLAEIEKAAATDGERPAAAEPSARAAPDPAPGGSTAPVSGPTADDVSAAQRMSPEERLRMIEGMVAGLAGRLEKDGRDLEGWLRLINAYSVLGRKGDAASALTRARQALAADAQAQGRLSALAAEKGL